MVAREQKTKRDNISKIVVINGLAITAGSSLHFFAINGSEAPTILASTIIIKVAKDTTSADFKSTPSILNSKPSINRILPKQTNAKDKPKRSETLISFQSTLKKLLN